MINPLDTQAQFRAFYKHLSKEFQSLQFVVTNSTDTSERIRLWGSNSNLSITTSEQSINRFNDSVVIGVGNYPQGMVYNPANDLFYVVNQLSDDVTVFDSRARIITTVALSPIPVASGTYSPTAITVNTKEDSLYYGEIYVLSSVRDTISVMTLNFTISEELSVIKRPTSFVYNPIDDALYVAGITEPNMFVIDIPTRSVEQRSIEGIPSTMGLDPDTGNVFIHIPELEQVYVYDTIHTRLALIDQITRNITAWAYHPISKHIYGILESEASLLAIDTLNFTEIRIALSGIGASIAYSTSEELIYIGETTNFQVLRLNADHQFTDPYPIADFETGIAIHPESGVVAFSKATANSVTLGRVAKQEVTIKEDYNEYRQEFQFSPAWVKHLKIISSDQLITTLELEDVSVSGKSERRSISIGNYNSPQNFLNVAEVFEIEGVVIDGLHRWYFTIPSQTTITLLIYYTKLDWFDVLENEIEKR
ncbi:YncE family protein [Dokdonia ponticola]|uniref:YncE family protein n=1 Tax=Dokdonia ponticola TaxID=2041041 RepID=A0ABV9HTJ9_9FLAO